VLATSTAILFVDRGRTQLEVDAAIQAIGGGALAECERLARVSFAGDSRLALIGAPAFYLSGLAEITIPKHVASIGADAFGHCRRLTRVLFAAGSELRTLRTGAFASSGLQSFQGPPKLTEIGVGAFARSAVRSVTLPEGVMRIPGSAFEHCAFLEVVTLAATEVVTIDAYAFHRACSGYALRLPHAKGVATKTPDWRTVDAVPALASGGPSNRPRAPP
jgi:hypothetical protein